MHSRIFQASPRRPGGETKRMKKNTEGGGEGQAREAEGIRLEKERGLVAARPREISY